MRAQKNAYKKGCLDVLHLITTRYTETNPMPLTLQSVMQPCVFGVASKWALKPIKMCLQSQL